MKKKISVKGIRMRSQSKSDSTACAREGQMEREFREILKSGRGSKRVRVKLAGYCRQDALRRPTLAAAVINPTALAKKMITDGFKCHYCQCFLTSGEEQPNSATQWTLDRIDNNLNHHLENCVFCCLDCNIKRGRKDALQFMKWRKVKIVKKPPIRELLPET